MRRITALAVTTGLAASLVGTLATGASAASDSHRFAVDKGSAQLAATAGSEISAKAVKKGEFSTKNGTSKAWRQLKAKGTWARSSKQVKVAPTLLDYKKDGFSPCVEFELQKGNKKLIWRGVYMVTTSKGTYYYDGRGKVSPKSAIVFPALDHLRVRECSMKPRRVGSNDKPYAYGPWSKIF